MPIAQALDHEQTSHVGLRKAQRLHDGDVARLLVRDGRTMLKMPKPATSMIAATTVYMMTLRTTSASRMDSFAPATRPPC